MRPTWFIDELAYAGHEHLDPGFVAGYDRKQGYPDAAEDLAVFARHGLGSESTILDLGAGTGQFALAAARHFGRVIAVDISPVMVQVMRERAADAGLTNVEVVRAGFLSYDHLGPPLDGVYTRNALHNLPDFWKAIALDGIATVLRPGGILRIHDLIYDFAPSEAEAIFDRWFHGAVGDPCPGTQPRTSRNISGPNSAPSGGCSSRSWPPPASTSCQPSSPGPSMGRTPAGSANHRWPGRMTPDASRSADHGDY